MDSQLTQERIVLDSIPQVPYFRELFGDAGIYLAGGISILAIFSTFNAGILGASRLVFALTREGNLPRWCAKISYTTGAPIAAIGLLGALSVLSSIVIVKYDLELIAAVIGSAIICFIYAAFVMAVIRLRRIKAEVSRPFRSTVPQWLRWFIIIFLPLMGVQSLVSQPGLVVEPLLGMLIFILCAYLLTRYSLALYAKRKVSAKS